MAGRGDTDTAWEGKQYVYEQFRWGGRVYTQYIGPLEEMVRVLQLYKTLGKAEKLSKRT